MHYLIVSSIFVPLFINEVAADVLQDDGNALVAQDTFQRGVIGGSYASDMVHLP